MTPRLPRGLPRRPARHGHRQRGAALLLAMIIMVLVTTLAASMVWQQYRAVQVEIAERARTQSAWILNGALDWARLILREDARVVDPNKPPHDHLGEPWAVPLQEARLSTFLAADRENNTDDAPEAFLSGSIVDAQSRYNLRNLIDGEGKIDARQQRVLQRLCESAGVSAEVATRLAEGLREAWNLEAGPATPLAPRTVAHLTWLGIDAETLRRLEKYIVILPAPSLINLNTAPREVLAAVLEGMDLATAERLVQTRERSAFQTVAQAQALLPPNSQINFQGTGVTSNYFEVSGRLRLGDRVLEERSLVQRLDREVTTLQHERVNLVASAP